MKENLSEEKILASIAKLGENITELGSRIDKLQGEFENRTNKLECRIDKLQGELGGRMDKLEDCTNKLGGRIDKLQETVDKNTHAVGILTNKFGNLIENAVVPGIVEKFNEKGFQFDSVSTNIEFLNENKTGNLTEVDALLENGSFVIAVETKADLKISDVNEHTKRLRKLRSLSRFKNKKIYGAFATAMTKKKTVNYALEQGFYVLKQPNVVNVEIIDFPNGYFAKAW